MSVARSIRSLWRRWSDFLLREPAPALDANPSGIRLPAGTVLRTRDDVILDPRDVRGDDAWLEVMISPETVRLDPHRLH